MLSALAQAHRNHDCATFTYEGGQGGDEPRVVEPHGLVHSGARWYLLAWDKGRDDWRTFRVDRIRGHVTCQGRFMPRAIPGGDVAGFVSTSVASLAYKYQARFIIFAPYDVVSALVSPLAAHAQPWDAKSCVLEAGANALEPLALHIASLGFDFVVQKPPELVERMRDLSQRLARATEASAASP